MEEYFLSTNTCFYILMFLHDQQLQIKDLPYYYFFIKVNICARIYINRLHFNFAMKCIVVLINHIINIHSF